MEHVSIMLSIFIVGFVLGILSGSIISFMFLRSLVRIKEEDRSSDA